MGNLFEELKRRKVFRVAAFYAAAAWVLMQVADVVLPALRMPDWVITVVVVALLLGLPLAIFLAWVFDWTPEGIVRESDAANSNADVPGDDATAHSWLDRLSTVKKTLAVLPFSNLSGDTDQEYFSDGLVEDIIMDLSLIPGLLVISRNSSFTFKGASVDISRVGKELNVNFVLQGSIRRSGNQLRVAAQLAETATAKVIWSKRYDRDIVDVFAMQDELTGEIVTAMDVELVSGAQGKLRRARRLSPEAAEVLYKGMYCFYQYEQSANVTARKYFNTLVQLEPDSILGYVWLVSAWTFAIIVRWEDLGLAIQNLHENVDKALAIDGADPQALVGDAYRRVIAGDLDRAQQSAEKAVQVAPNAEEAYRALGWVQMLSGDAVNAVKNVERSARLCPVMNSLHWGILATAYRNAGRYEEAVGTLQSCLKRFPDFVFAHAGLAVAYSFAGDDEMAVREVKEVLRQDPDYSIKRFVSPDFYRDKSVMAKCADALRKAGLPDQ